MIGLAYATEVLGRVQIWDTSLPHNPKCLYSLLPGVDNSIRYPLSLQFSRLVHRPGFAVFKTPVTLK